MQEEQNSPPQAAQLPRQLEQKASPHAWHEAEQLPQIVDSQRLQ
jgi:hypothetical protein